MNMLITDGTNKTSSTLLSTNKNKDYDKKPKVEATIITKDVDTCESTLITPGRSTLTIEKPKTSSLLVKSDPNLCEIDGCASEYLKVDNCLSEFDTEEQRLAALRNLGIETLASWGNISGYIEDQKDLMEYLHNNVEEWFIDELLKVDDKNVDVLDFIEEIKYDVKNPDINLNQSFVNALEKTLNGNNIACIKDALDVIIYALFPITYKDWVCLISAENKLSYDIEKGTSLTLNPEDIAGKITINLIPGNKGDLVVSLTFDSENILQKDNFIYNKDILVKDITQLTQINSSLSKNYEINLLTTSGYEISLNKEITILLNTFQYYFFETSDKPLSINEGDVYEPNENTIKQKNKNEYLFDLKNSEKYLTIISPKDITKVETAAGTSINTLTAYTPITGYSKKKVKYKPNDTSSEQNYYLIQLDSAQSNFVKVRVS